MKDRKFLKGTSWILVSALMIAGAAGTLGITMAKAQEDTIQTEVKDGESRLESDTVTGEGVVKDDVQEVREVTEDDQKEVSKTGDAQKKEKSGDSSEKDDAIIEERAKTETSASIQKQYGFPKGTVVKGNEDGDYSITWNGYSILLAMGDFEKTEGDMDLPSAIERAVQKIKEEYGVTLTGGELQIKADDSDSEIELREKAGSRRYYLTFFVNDKSGYNVNMNTVTGEVYEYSNWNIKKNVTVEINQENGGISLEIGDEKK